MPIFLSLINHEALLRQSLTIECLALPCKEWFDEFLVEMRCGSVCLIQVVC